MSLNLLYLMGAYRVLLIMDMGQHLKLLCLVFLQLGSQPNRTDFKKTETMYYEGLEEIQPTIYLFGPVWAHTTGFVV